MKFHLLTAAGILPVLARCDYEPSWEGPGADDVRAPCPMLNSLANHGFLPHDGKKITLDILSKGLEESLNIQPALTKFLFDFAITTNPDANATDFSLDNLGRHNILEHDASLSREDLHYGDPSAFSEKIFNETKSYWTGDVITLEMAAAARHARVITSATNNPTFSLSELGASFGYGETAAYLIFFGDIAAGEAKREWVEYFFENERLPYSLGWSKPATPLAENDLFDMMDRVMNATKTTAETPPVISKRGDLHAGVPPVAA